MTGQLSLLKNKRLEAQIITLHEINLLRNPVAAIMDAQASESVLPSYSKVSNYRGASVLFLLLLGLLLNNACGMIGRKTGGGGGGGGERGRRQLSYTHNQILTFITVPARLTV